MVRTPFIAAALLAAATVSTSALATVRTAEASDRRAHAADRTGDPCVENSDDPAAQSETVSRMAAAASAHGIDITFSLDETMLEYLATAPPVVINTVRVVEHMGHQFGLHADLAGMGQRATLRLAEMQATHRTVFGHVGLSLSGACTQSGDWIAAANANDIWTVAGVVTYCEAECLSTEAYAGTVYEDEIATAKSVCTRPSIGARSATTRPHRRRRLAA